MIFLGKKRWVKGASKEVRHRPVDVFLEEIGKVCKKHGFSISHEDSGGGFIIEHYSESTQEWLGYADIGFNPEEE